MAGANSQAFDVMLTTQEAAEIIGVDDSRVRQMLSKGEIKGKKHGKRAWMISKKEAERVRDNPSSLGRPRGSAA